MTHVTSLDSKQGITQTVIKEIEIQALLNARDKCYDQFYATILHDDVDEMIKQFVVKIDILQCKSYVWITTASTLSVRHILTCH